MWILRESARIFTEQGYHQTSINELAQQLGVAKPILYYYADSKDDLLFSCGQIARDELGRAMEQAQAEHYTGRQKIERFFREYTQIMATDFGRCLALIDPKSLAPATRTRDLAGRRELEGLMREMIREGQSDGTLRECDPAIAARVLFGAFNAIARWYRPTPSLSPPALADAYLDIIVDGLSAP
jgi:AcrR family transcriptional regulator